MSGRPAARGPRRRGISLAEMMIAVVILGLGLLMVASLFPVSWLSARRLAENTTQFASRQAADLTVRTLLRVDGERTDVAVSLGDQIQFCVCTDCSDQGQLSFEAGSIEFDGNVSFPIGRVHTLNLGNVLYEGGRAFVGDEAWRLERTRVGELLRAGGTFNIPDSCDCPFRKRDNTIDFDRLPNALKPVIALQDRVYPPLPNRPSDDFTRLTPDNRRWDEALSTRRYAWSVLYRFDQDYVCRSYVEQCRDDDNGENYLELKYLDETRVMTMFYVTLRRPKATARYARQDPEVVPHPDPREARVTQVQALGADQDVMFPVPWRVQVLFPEIILSKSDPLRAHISSEITVNHRDARIDLTQPSWVTGLFARGTMFIDELTGSVYRVEKARLTDDDRTANLTLDREIVLEDVDTPRQDPDLGYCRQDGTATSPNGMLDRFERLRTVWVFPPPVQGDRGAGDPLVFDGSPPVVDIAVQTVMISP